MRMVFAFGLACLCIVFSSSSHPALAQGAGCGIFEAVEPGDTFETISRRCAIPVSRLTALNPRVDKDEPEPGSVVNVAKSGIEPVAKQSEGDTQAAAPITLEESRSDLDYHYLIPREAAAVAPLRALLLEKARKTKRQAISDQHRYAADLPDGAPAHPFGIDIEWMQVAETSQLLTFVSQGYIYQGGAHGGDRFETLLWDRKKARAISFADLFTDEAAAVRTLRKSFCNGLEKARSEKLGAQAGAGAFPCPDFEYVTFAPTHVVGGKFGRIGVWIPAGVAGAHAEGAYSFEIYIPKAMIRFVAPRWQPSFPG